MRRAIADPEAFARRAEAYYAEHLRAKLEPDHKGKFLVLDPETGDYEMDENQAVAFRRAIAKHPNAFFHIMRVGYRTAARMGARFRRMAGEFRLSRSL